MDALESKILRGVLERLQTGLIEAGFARDDVGPILDDCVDIFRKQQSSLNFPNEFYDVRRSLSRIQNVVHMPLDDIRAKIVQNPQALFEAYKTHKQKKTSYPLSYEEIGMAGVKVQKEKNRMPNRMDGNLHLPEDMKWSGVLTYLYRNHTSIGKVIADLNSEDYEIKRGRNKKFIPADTILVRAALHVHRDTGHPLNLQKGGYERLPEGSASWATIRTDLNRRNVTMPQLIEKFEEARNRRATPEPPASHETSPEQTAHNLPNHHFRK